MAEGQASEWGVAKVGVVKGVWRRGEMEAIVERCVTAVSCCQVLQSTGEWLARDMEYREYAVDWASTSLYPPFMALYYGCAYMEWLSTYKGR